MSIVYLYANFSIAVKILYAYLHKCVQLFDVNFRHSTILHKIVIVQDMCNKYLSKNSSYYSFLPCIKG